MAGKGKESVLHNIVIHLAVLSTASQQEAAETFLHKLSAPKNTFVLLGWGIVVLSQSPGSCHAPLPCV